MRRIELAQDGIVTQTYPLAPNRQALGLNMLEDEERRASANLALEVTCDVPNDRWYFEIMLKGGWYSRTQMDRVIAEIARCCDVQE